MKTFVIGDIHGGYRGMIQALERAQFDPEVDKLISLGDIADGWSEVPECVDYLLKCKNLIAIRGNHDIWCWNWFTWGHTPLIWTQQGGQATLDAYIKCGKVVDEGHKKFWDNQVDYYLDDQNRLFVHAGFDVREGFEWSKHATVNIPRATELHWDRSLAELTEAKWEKSLGNNAKSNVHQFKEIYIGHTAHNSVLFNKCANIWNIDTGGGWYGKITVMNIDTKEYFQSDTLMDLYPDEKGRR